MVNSGLEWGEAEDRLGDPAEELFGHRDGLLVAPRDDLRQLGQFLHGLSLGHPLGAEGDADVAARLGHQIADLLGRAGVDRAPQDDALAVDQVGQEAREEPAHRVEGGVEVLVDGGADDDDDEPRAGDELRVVVDLQRPADDLAQGRLGPALQEGHAAGAAPAGWRRR